jgi:TP901 family phage tail tape measure protein
MADFANLVIGVDTSGLKRGERDMQSFGGSAKKSFNAVALAATAALGAFVSLGSAVRIIAEFETSISRLGAVSRATGSELKDLRDIAKELGSTTEFSASQAADGLNFLAMAGFNATEAMAAIPAVLDLATASQMGLAEAADTASNIMSGFGIAADNAAQVADVLAAASTRANTTVGQLGAAMSTVAPIAAALDMTLSDTAAAIGVLSDAGIQGERAGTALRGVLASLAGPTSEAEKVLKGLGLTLADVDPAANDLSVVMARLGAAGLSTADAMTLFGREAASGALVLIDGAQRVGEFGDELDRVDGAAKAMAATMRDNLGGDLKGVISAAQGLAIALGDAGLTAIIRAVVQSITGLVRGLTSVVELFGKVTSFISSLGATETAFRNVALASDAVNKSIDEQLAQQDSLTVALQGGRTVSLDYAGAMLENARASLVAAEATRQRRIEEIKATEVFQQLVVQQAAANRLSQDLQNLFSGSPVSDELRRMADASLAVNGNLSGMLDLYKSTLAKLKDNVAEQNLLTGNVGKTSDEVLRLEKEIRLIEASIKAADGGMVVLGGNTDASAKKAEILSTTITNINFSNAISGASFLANDLGVNIDLANKLNAALNRTAGIAEAKPAAGGARGLGFGLGNADTGAIAGLTLAYGDLSGSASEVNSTIATLNKNYEDSIKPTKALSKAAKDAAADAKELADEIQRLEFNADPIKKYNAELEALNKLSAAGLSDGAYAKAVQDLNDGLADSFPLIGSVSDAFGDFVAGGLSDFKGFVSTILGSFKSMLSQMIATAARNKIMIGMGIGGSSVGTVANAATGGGAGLLGGLGASTGLFASSVGTGLSVVGSGFMAGGFGGAATAGMGAIGGGIGAGGAMGFGTALGAALPFIGAAVLAIGLFSKKTKLLDEGLQLTVNGMDSLVESFSKTKTSRFFGLSSSTRTNTSQLDAAAASPFTTAIDGIQKSVLSAAAGLGVGADAFSKFSFGFQLSLKGLTEEQKMSAVTAELAKMGDAFAAVVPGISNLNELLAVSAERYNLQNRVLELQGRGEELLARQRAAQMNATNGLNKAILQQIFNLEDAASAQARADILAQEAAQAAAQVAQEVAQKVAQAAQDAAQAVAALVSSINENDFATGVDFRRGLARASSGIASTPQQSQAEMLAELKALNARIDVLQSTSEITANSSAQTAENTDFSNALTLDAAA